jgi:hypothetical protein
MPKQNDLKSTFPSTKFTIAGKPLKVSGHVTNPEDNEDLWVWEFLFNFDGTDVEISDGKHALKDLNKVIKLIYAYL